MALYQKITVETATRSVARFWSILSIILILIYFIGGDINFSSLTFKEWIGFLLFPVGTAAGLVISWKKELTGSIISIVSVVIFAFLIGAGWFIYGLALPALLFLAYALLARKYPEK